MPAQAEIGAGGVQKLQTHALPTPRAVIFRASVKAIPPRSVLFFWTVHRAAVGGFAAYGCGIPPAGAARFLFGKSEKDMGGAFPPAKPASSPRRVGAIPRAGTGASKEVYYGKQSHRPYQ